MDITVKRETIEVCKQNYITLEELFMMYTTFVNEDWGIEVSAQSLNKLMRMGLMESDVKLTEAGIELLALALSPDLRDAEAVSADRFEEFWKMFPYSDKQLGFPFTRVIRTNHDGTRAAYMSALSNGYTEEQLIEALRTDIDQRVNSVRRFVENPFRFMKSPKRWLDDKDYLNVLKEDNKEEAYDTDDLA